MSMARGDRTCATCRFWEGRGHIITEHHWFRECRRNAPVAGNHKWPRTQQGDWCGEWATPEGDAA